MPIDPPNLDDRSFEDIVAEAKSLIPRYAPEWTNHNESDPGITLIQLFAWMNEAVLFRLNQVPDLHYLKFLQLLGIEQRPAQPARVDLAFTTRKSFAGSEVWLPRFTQVAVAGAGGDEPLVFEVERSIAVLPAKLNIQATFDGRRHVVDEWPLLPFGRRPEPGTALVFGLESTQAFTSELVELAIYVEDVGEQASCGDPSRFPTPARLEWEYWDAPRARWRRLDVSEDETRAFTRSGRVRFTGPGEDFVRSVLPDIDEERYWIRARLVDSDYDRPPRVEAIAINTVLATQAVTVYDEVLGTSDGSPDQVVRTRRAPLVIDEVPERLGDVVIKSVRVDVIEIVGAETRTVTWSEVESFDRSSGDDLHFVVNHATGTIRFGDGERGQIPGLRTQLVARRYRYGGGALGRVGAGTVTEMLGLTPDIDKATNPRPSWGGADEEPLERTKRKAAGLLKARDRAVTSEDFETLTLQTPFVSIARARALPLVHPDFPGVRVPGAVTVIVVPEVDSPAPSPSETMLRSVCVHLDDKRLLTTELHVVAPTYRQLGLEIDLVADPRADLARVEKDVEARIREFLHPLRGGTDGQGWPFGGPLFFSEVYRQVLGADDVLRVEQDGLRITLDGDLLGDCRDAMIGDTELFELVSLDARPRYEVQRR